MASDVEVLRWLAKISAVVADVAGRPNDEVDRALSSALATLEAREAQPKVKGRRLTDAQVAGGYEKTPGAPNAKSLRKDHLATRASEAALREIYLPLSVRNGGLEGLARYYRQTRDFIKRLQEREAVLKADLDAAHAAHKRDINEFIEVNHDLSVREEALSKRVEELEKYMAWARQRLDLDTIESVLMEYLVTNSEIERIMVGMTDRLGGARYRGHTHLGPNDECGNTDCDALGPHARCFKDGRWLDDGSEM